MTFDPALHPVAKPSEFRWYQRVSVVVWMGLGVIALVFFLGTVTDPSACDPHSALPWLRCQ